MNTVWRRGTEVVNVAERNHKFEKNKSDTFDSVFFEIDECEKEILVNENPDTNKLLASMTKLRNLVSKIAPNKRNDDDEDGEDLGSDYDFENDVDV